MTCSKILRNGQNPNKEKAPVMSKGYFGNLTYWKFHVFNKKSDVTWHAPVPGRDHARHILQKMKIHEIHFEMVKIQIRNRPLTRSRQDSSNVEEFDIPC